MAEGLTPETRRTLGGATLHILADPVLTAEAAARHVAALADRAIGERGRFRVALAGGTTPRATYERLARGDLPIDWTRVSVFFGDERMVSPVDPKSNYRMAREALLDRVPIPEAAVHRIPGELPPEAAVQRYADLLGDSPLDLVLLGMGDDGHVASLFPGGPEVESSARVLHSRAPVSPHERISIGFSVIASARAVALLVTGTTKAARVREVFDERARGAPRLPAARVAPARGTLDWFLDAAAASELPGLPAKDASR